MCRGSVCVCVAILKEKKKSRGQISSQPEQQQIMTHHLQLYTIMECCIIIYPMTGNKYTKNAESTFFSAGVSSYAQVSEGENKPETINTIANE